MPKDHLFKKKQRVAMDFNFWKDTTEEL